LTVRFAAGVEPDENSLRSGWWFVFRNGDLLVRLNGGIAELPQAEQTERLRLQPLHTHYLGALGIEGCWTGEASPEYTPLPPGFTFEPLRALYGVLAEDLYAVAGRAVQVVEWDRTHRYCGRCGTATNDIAGERAKRCPNCGLLSYPRISPAVIVLVARDDELLLARSPHFPAGMYSVLAGFVEPGESLEDTVAREIGEETGIGVKSVRYFGSQPWPYPNSLMIGFTAVYAGGELTPDPREIEAAAWYTRNNLPKLPGKPSIARALID